MNRSEYWILRCAVTYHAWLRDVAYKCGLSHAEVAVAANCLFQNGDIQARVFANEKDVEGTPSVILTVAEIQAHLDGKLRASYELTPQGGTRWESAAHADWNRYFLWFNNNKIIESELFEWELIGVDRQLIESLLSDSGYVYSDFPVPGTEVWDVLEPWQPTYWKILPFAYRVCYQAKESKSVNTGSETSPSWYQEYEQAQERYGAIKKWYTDPEFDDKESSSLINYTAANYDITSNEIALKKAEYFILKRVVERYGDYYDDFGCVSLDCHLSHNETLAATNYLFQKGDILAEVYRNGILVSDVVMTVSEIQANLEGKFSAHYYLTPQGGERWEALASANWNQYYIYFCQDYRLDAIAQYECQITSVDRQLIEQLFSLHCYLFNDKIFLPGTEVWDLVEPWSATYWKTLPRAYRIRFQATENRFIKANVSSEWEETSQQAYQWFSEIQKWYTDPSFD